MLKENEIGVEISFLKRFNLGNFNHKEYSVKLTGKQSQIEEQLNNEQQRLTNYIAQLESIVEIANDANKLKARVEANSVQSTSGSGKMQEL
jgi:23S rRNA pseudoU1915 N3-methylase RlmH